MPDYKYTIKVRYFEFLLIVDYLCNAIYGVALEYNYDYKRIYKNCNLRGKDSYILDINHGIYKT